MLTDAGLAQVRTAHRIVQAAFRDAEHLLAFSWSHGQRAMWEATPADRHATLRAQISELVHQLEDGGGPLVVNQHVRYTLGHRPV